MIINIKTDFLPYINSDGADFYALRSQLISGSPNQQSASPGDSALPFV